MGTGLDRHTNRTAHNRIALEGRRFGKLIVVKDTGLRKSRRPIWLCQCDCGRTTQVLGKYLLNGDTKSCGCFSTGNAHNRDSIGEIALSYWTPIYKQAVRRGIPFSITREYAWALFLSQDGLCALSGVPIAFAINMRDERTKHSASLDRIDNKRGYVEGNVQWVHKVVNIMKNVSSQEDFIDWCQKIAEYSRPETENSAI